MKIYTHPDLDWEVERKADNSPLTLADRRSHAVIAQALDMTPYPLLSEEGCHEDYAVRKQWETLWICDPLDGTKEFIKRNGEFTVNIALIHEGVPVAGVIYVPVRKELYYGSCKAGAYKLSHVEGDAQPAATEMLQLAQRLPNAQCHQGIVVVASRSHMNEETSLYVDDLRKQGQPVTLISSGSSLKICLVAEGAADVYPRFAPTMEWDTAAGHAIAKAAGCEIYHIDEKTPLRYNKEDLHNPWFIVK